MNANSKLDVHPDAEILNAFAEQALEERERGKIVAHLAGCSRCRQVVYLAQDATAEMVPSVVTPDVRLEGRRESWFRSWRFALVPVAALAAIAALAYIVHVQRIGTGSEMAKVTPQAAPQTAGSNSAAPAQATGVAEEGAGECASCIVGAFFFGRYGHRFWGKRAAECSTRRSRDAAGCVWEWKFGYGFRS